jgi:hypothetical protein
MAIREPLVTGDEEPGDGDADADTTAERGSGCAGIEGGCCDGGESVEFGSGFHLVGCRLRG